MYSVNSGETYVLEIDEVEAGSALSGQSTFDKLGNMAILSQADKVEDTVLEASSSPRDVRSEGATTIPLGSRA